MNIEEVRDFSLSLPHVTEDMPYGPDWVVFRVGGKIFLHIVLEGDEPHIAIKLPPEMGQALREKYDCVRPAYHLNKVHWNDVFVENTINDRLIRDWIRQSYDLVYAKLTRKIRAELGNIHSGD
ncbi:MAG: MmcQ/YjbR family DNA-binding protein [Prevotella sp.]|jgi:predicted DNA-binding protein (MmcQ/YjbR family)